MEAEVVHALEAGSTDSNPTQTRAAPVNFSEPCLHLYMGFAVTPTSQGCGGVEAIS